MKLVTFTAGDDRQRIGAVDGEGAVVELPAGDDPAFASMLALIDAGPAGLGLMAAAWAAGALAGTVVAGNVRARRQGLVLLASVAVSGLAMMAVGIAGGIGTVVIALAVMGVAIGYVNIVAISWMQARVTSDMVGRVMSLAMLMGFGITPISLGLAGALIDADATALFVGAGLLVLLVAGAAMVIRYPAAFDAMPLPRGQEVAPATQ